MFTNADSWEGNNTLPRHLDPEDAPQYCDPFLIDDGFTPPNIALQTPSPKMNADTAYENPFLNVSSTHSDPNQYRVYQRRRLANAEGYGNTARVLFRGPATSGPSLWRAFAGYCCGMSGLLWAVWNFIHNVRETAIYMSDTAELIGCLAGKEITVSCSVCLVVLTSFILLRHPGLPRTVFGRGFYLLSTYKCSILFAFIGVLSTISVGYKVSLGMHLDINLVIFRC